MLEEGVGNHCHEGMAMKALPRSTLEVIEAEFFLELLVRLFAHPSRLDGGRQGAQVSRRRQVGEIVFLLSRHPVLTDEPSLTARQMLLTLVPDPLWRSIGDPHAQRRKTSLELSFGAGAPIDGAPWSIGQGSSRLVFCTSGYLSRLTLPDLVGYSANRAIWDRSNCRRVET